VQGVSSDFSILGLAGINLDNEGQLNIDSSTLRGYLGSNFDDIKLLFSANGSASSGTIEYLSHSRTTKTGEHTLNITQAATRSTTTSNTAVAATLGSDETLTITTEGRTANIALTSDMTIVDIINSINAELATIYTESLAGSTAVQAGGVAITAATKWTDIDGGQLVNGDVIALTGTTRHGSSISGSYTISDTSADAVQGLLSEIESAFDDDVTAAIDSTGHLVITDKYAGDSQLSLTFDYTGTLNGVDIFGPVLTSNQGGQEGRNALEITASTDASNHLVLTHDRYGSSYSFTVSETSDLLWTGGDQTVANGKDVEGTINGETATGSGQTLAGDEGTEDVEGLVIKYTGTDTGEVGNILLTLGVAELFDRALFHITDPYDGYLSFKQESLKNSIDLFEGHIEDMEVRLDLKMERMINQFVAMEVALSKMQSQSQWLSGQIDAIYSGWV
jgi:flagellar hook-associated protein 2